MSVFLYLSHILNKKVHDRRGKVVGRLYDLAMSLGSDVFPKADHLMVCRGLFKKQYADIPATDLDEINGGLYLNKTIEEIAFKPEWTRPEFSLRRDVLDQQVVDVDDQRVVRVNDVHLMRVEQQVFLAHVDVGLRGLIRRLNWAFVVDTMMKLIAPGSSYFKGDVLLSWRNAQLLTIGRKKNILRLSDARSQLARIPPAELADIMENLDVFEKVSLFKFFAPELQCRVFTDMPPQEKEDLIDRLDDKEAAALLENIPADEATDLLHKFPKEKRLQWMRLMQTEQSKKLRMLLGFAQDSAGGLMTAEYLTLKNDATVQDAFDLLKANVNAPANLNHIYVIDDKNHLVGVTSLRTFIAAPPEKSIMEACYSIKISVHPEDGVEEIALLLEKYKFSSIPVVDEHNVLQGVITTDDVMEELISLIWTKYKDQI